MLKRHSNIKFLCLFFYGIVIFTKLFHTEKNSILKKITLSFFFFLIISFVHGGIMGFQNLVGPYHKNDHLYNEWWYGLIM